MTRTRSTTSHLGAIGLGAVAVALAAAFVLLPPPLAAVLSGYNYGDEQQLTGTVTTAFVDYWQGESSTLTTELSQLVDYWRWFHVIKVVMALGLLVVLLVLAGRLGTAYAGTNDRAVARRTVAGGVVVSVLGVVAFVLALANIQASVAPFASLMSLLPIGSADGALADMIAQVRQQLGQYPAGRTGPLTMMVDDLAHYHAVFAVLCWLAAALLVVLTAATWRAFARTATTQVRRRRLLRWFGTATALLIGFLVLLAVANTTTAANSPTAVQNFYNGSF